MNRKGNPKMSINIPAETEDESTNPISVEEFERLHPAMLGAIRKAVREEPVRTVIGTVGGDKRSHLSTLTCEASASRSDGSCRPAT